MAHSSHDDLCTSSGSFLFRMRPVISVRTSYKLTLLIPTSLKSFKAAYAFTTFGLLARFVYGFFRSRFKDQGLPLSGQPRSLVSCRRSSLCLLLPYTHALSQSWGSHTRRFRLYPDFRDNQQLLWQPTPLGSWASKAWLHSSWRYYSGRTVVCNVDCLYEPVCFLNSRGLRCLYGRALSSSISVARGSLFIILSKSKLVLLLLRVHSRHC